MKRDFLGGYLLYLLVRGLSFLFRLMPIPIAIFIGRRCGEAAMFLNAKRRRIAYANLKAAFSGRYSPKDLRRILRKTYANMGQGAMEVLLLPKMDEEYASRYLKYEDFHFAEDVLKKGKGLIFLTAHFGNWEMANIALPIRGFKYIAIAREQKPYLLNQLLNKYRESKGCRIVLKGMGVKEALRSLRSNGVVGMLVDQDAGRNGIFVDFFGRAASWHRGVMEFAIKTGASVVPGFAIREAGPYIRFKVFKPIELPDKGTEEEIIREGFRQYIGYLEETIKSYPDQWLWQHRRWKSTTVREVLILNDERTGHLRQSEAVAYKLKDIWRRKGYKDEDVRVNIVDVRFRNNFYRGLLRLECNLSNFYCQGCMSCLRLYLTEGSYRALMASYADIIISCGSSNAAVNLMLSRENNARSIAIMKPPLIDLGRFNLAIVPKHDNPPRLKNVIITDGALNLINNRSLKIESEKLLARTGPLKNRVMGVLIGGPTKGFTMERVFIDLVLEEVIKASYEYDCELLLTTSRRTPKDIETLIKERLQHEPRCKLLVIANENNPEGTVGGILGLSKISLVSQESISMISEAASAGPYTIVFRQGVSQDKRHEAFLDNLRKNNFIEVVEAKKIYSAISSFFTKQPKQCILDDSGKIEEALVKLL